MAKSPKKKVTTGSVRMRTLGKKPSQLWYPPEQYDLVKRAAFTEHLPMATFAILATVAAAKNTLSELRELTDELMKIKGIRHGEKT